MSLSKTLSWARRLTSRYPPDRRITSLRNQLLARASGAVSPGERPVALQCLEDPYYFGLFAAIGQRLRESKGAPGDLVVVRSISGAVGDGWQQRLARSALLGTTISSQWVRAFRGIVDRVAYRSLSIASPVTNVADWFRSRIIWRRERLNPDISSLRVLDVPVGDLIIDSYLRFRPSPRFVCADPFVKRLIWQAHRDVRLARRYFRDNRPKVYLTSYSTYIEHGIPVRVALLEGVRVRSFGNFVEFGKELTLKDWFHTPNTDHYRATFAGLDSQAQRLAQAEGMIRQRMSGAIDTSTSYMRVSAYAATNEPMPDVGGAVVVFLHDFYDSPHVYDNLIFPDFWTWICFTIDTLNGSGQKFFLKPHPNQISLSNAVLQELMAKYPGVAMLTATTTNVQLATAGIACGVTMSGTVAHELAYLGIPTIACAKHPHHAFDFCRTASTRDEYREYLSDPQYLPVGRDEMRRQALAFYYMHNLYGGADRLSLRDRAAAFWKACSSAEASDAILESFNELRDSRTFKAAVDQLY